MDMDEPNPDSLAANHMENADTINNSQLNLSLNKMAKAAATLENIKISLNFIQEL